MPRPAKVKITLEGEPMIDTDPGVATIAPLEDTITINDPDAIITPVSTGTQDSGVEKAVREILYFLEVTDHGHPMLEQAKHFLNEETTKETVRILAVERQVYPQ